MKVVIKLTSKASESNTIARFARAVDQLFQDPHSVVVVHGANGQSNAWDSPILCGSVIAQVGLQNRNLVSALIRAGASALGVCGGDGQMCEMRLQSPGSGRDAVELGRMNCRWVEVICSNRGVPVISNLVSSAWQQHYLVNPDQLAAECAKSWRADALIYVTSVEGIRDQNGAIIRWLDIRDIKELQENSTIAQNMILKLRACTEALKAGVPRVRILSICHVESLPSFFCSRIDVGTEIVALEGCTRTA